MYAIIVTGGKQYRVTKGNVVYVEKLDAEEGKNVEFNEVLVVGDGKDVKIGAPTVAGASVTGKVIKHGKNKKVTVFTYRPKKDSKRKMGHRQQFTKVEITAIKG
ncbi:MAG: 50S ribosomal protein L21 [Oscillospiraceae bacterium]|nr:50S ribosomal protein L21 [Oscillospiraceae bacterium]